jgi:hypothetical protein
MSTRLKVRLVIMVIAAVVYLGIKLTSNSHRVTFSPANLSVDVGKGWTRVRSRSGLPQCSPVMVSSAGMIGAIMLDSEVTDIKEATDKLQSSLAIGAKISEDKFKQESFSTASGLQGIHLIYTTKGENSGDSEVRSHKFVTHNMLSRCVAISYITSPESESAGVIENIERTLRVE